jgi:large exoprotein involved in heme utilization and adhesion
VLGNANLFLLNPNGIVFGPNADLDITGSFTVTTANAIQLGDRGFFSATQPQQSTLLSVSPGVLLYNQIAAQGGRIINEGNLTVGAGQDLTLFGNTVIHSGSLNALGGMVKVLGDRIGLFDQATINVASPFGGGTVLIGGDLQGKGSVPNASQTFVGAAVNINADATESGNGGKVIVWANQTTRFDGKISARGGPQSGNGGFVEISGLQSLHHQGRVDASAPRGTIGTLLLDPTNIEIVNLFTGDTDNLADADQFIDPNLGINGTRLDVFALDLATANVILQATNDIIFNADIINFNPGVNITAQAGNDIAVNRAIATTNGAVNLIAGRDIVANGFPSFISTLGGDVLLQAGRNIALTNEASVRTQVLFNPVGNGGTITVQAGGNVVLSGFSQMLSTVSSGVQGDAGGVLITAGENVSLADASAIFSNVSIGGTGNGGTIDIRARSLTLTDASEVTASTGGIGNAGNINLQIGDSIVLNNGGGLFSRVRSTATGNGGVIDIQTRSLSLTNGAQVTASTLGIGNAGTLKLNAVEFIDAIANSSILAQVFEGAQGEGGQIEISTGRLRILDGSVISAGSLGQGRGGTLDVTALDLVEVSGNNSGITADTTGSESAGNLAIKTRQLVVQDNAIISTTTFGAGNSGTLTIQASDSVTVTGPAAILTRVNEGSTGNGGDLTITTQRLTIQNGAQVGAGTFGDGNSGKLTITALDRINLNGTGSGLFTQTQGQGDANTLTLQTKQLMIQNGATVSSGTFGNGQGGTLTIAASDLINLSDLGSSLVTQTDGNGDAGNLQISTRQLTLQTGSRISAATSGAGNAGNVFIRDADMISLSGNSLISSAVNSGASGQGGDVEITTSDLNLMSGAIISTRSQGPGKAGNIMVQASRDYRANNGQILATADQSGGGSINITANDIRLQGNSDIKTNVFSGVGNGGNITLAARSILAFDDSDILAFARDGRGGNVTLNTRAFFGQNYRPAPFGTDPLTLDGNNRVDINASGTVFGIITLPDVSFIQNSLTQLSQTAIDTNQLLATSCIVRRNQPNPSSFYITGPGGLPDRPGTPSSPAFPTGEIRNLATDPNSQSAVPRSWQIGDPIQEPDGVYQLPNGELILSHQCR